MKLFGGGSVINGATPSSISKVEVNTTSQEHSNQISDSYTDFLKTNSFAQSKFSG